MPAWILAALRLLALAGLAGAGAEVGARALPGETQLLGGGGFVQGPFIDAPFRELKQRFAGEEPSRRRRRRRALTASDRADIAFIAGMISKAAAKDFAVQLAARPR